MALLLGITAMMMTPALAADYEFDAPDGGMYAPPTSVDQVIVVGGGVTESSNIDRSKNTADSINLYARLGQIKEITQFGNIRLNFTQQSIRVS